MTTDQDELIRFMREWANEGPLAPRVLDSRTYADLAMFVWANSPRFPAWADYDKALDQFAQELHAAGRLGDGMRHRVGELPGGRDEMRCDHRPTGAIHSHQFPQNSGRGSYGDGGANRRQWRDHGMTTRRRSRPIPSRLPPVVRDPPVRVEDLAAPSATLI